MRLEGARKYEQTPAGAWKEAYTEMVSYHWKHMFELSKQIVELT